jgi:SH3-like domain-containing protein
MKIWGKLLVFLIIVVPIIVCFKVIEGIWDDDIPTTEIPDAEEQSQDEKDMQDDINDVITGTIGGTEYTAKENPIGKIVEGGSINISVANIYKDPDETSEILGRLQKNVVVISQAYPDGWSIIKSDNLTGWVKSENITLPSEIGYTSIGTAVGRTGVVTVDSLNIREKADSNSKKIESLTIDTEVKIVGIEGDWYKISLQNIEGWCSSKYIRLK